MDPHNMFVILGLVPRICNISIKSTVIDPRDRPEDGARGVQCGQTAAARGYICDEMQLGLRPRLPDSRTRPSGSCDRTASTRNRLLRRACRP
ncbi:hypothetical protein DTW90_03675 [Neorhizobium sp. P12A]|nr:hypothetical protein DTW90_03675 [Neorhizobium sp. P12A]